MSATKSNTSSTSNGTGPSKFRKDAAIFSPKNYVHPGAANSYMQPPGPMNPPMGMTPMNPMGMNMMNVNMNLVNSQFNGAPPSMNGDIYGGYTAAYNPYMVYPQYEYNPYAAMPFVPPTSYKYMPTSPMYGQMPNMMNMPPDANVRNKRKPYNKSQSATPRSFTTKSSETSPASTDATDPIVEEEQKEEELPRPVTAVSDKETSVESSEPVTSETEEPEQPEILRHLPLYINTSSSEFHQDRQFLVKRRESFKAKSILQVKDLIISKPSTSIIDYNKKEEGDEKYHSIKKDWASIVSVSSKKPKSKTPQVSQQKDAATEMVPLVPVTKATQEIDSVGLLSLKCMFNLLEDSDSSDYFHIYSRGLTNSGNICYMNSILQVLIYCEPFNKLFRILEQKSTGSLNESKTPLIDAIISIFRDFSTSGTKSLSPEGFYMKLSGHRKFQHLKWGQQEDAEEFLGYLLDGLHEELVHSIREVNNEQISLLLETVADNETKLQIKNAIKIIKKLNNSSNGGNDNDNSNDDDDNEGWNEIGGGHKKVSSKRTVEIEPSPIKTIFGGQFRSVLQIPNKKDQSITLDPFQCIQLDIKADQINNIEDAFKQLNEPEQIPFKLNDNKEVLAKKQTFIDSLPDVLVIHLKRFSFENVNNGNIEKLRKKIEYTHKLSIPLELFSNWRKSVNRDYKLTGVVYHHGIIAEGGHYTCDVLRPMTVSDSSRWIRIDDTSINNIDEDDVLSNDDDTKNAYLLFYQKL